MSAAGHGDFFKRVVDLYSEHAPRNFDQLVRQAEAHDAAGCAALAHALKSMSVNIGATLVARIASEFERKARGDGSVPDRSRLETLSHALKRTLIFMTEGAGHHDLAPPLAAISIGTSPHGELEGDLRLALARQELDLEYQPLVDRDGKEVVAVEALVRWRRGGVENVPPSVFIPMAEQSGVIDDIGEWVLRRACCDARAWPGLTVAINVSPVQFRRAGLADRIERIFAEAEVDPNRIMIEITETATLDAEDEVRRTIEQLHRRGVSFALDDFGTGYSSLTCLRRFQFNEIKVDRSFVSNVGLTIDATIIQAVVSIGRALGLKVVAEGVETVEQHAFLRAAGVHVMQGYLFARPMKTKDVTAFINDRARSPMASAS
jgi:two-component system, NarL family, sensor histidine kinase BarA